MPQKNRTTTGVLGGLLGLVGLSAVAGVLVTATVTPALAVSSAAATSAINMFDNLPSVLTIDKLILPSTIYAKNDKGQYTTMATFYDQNRSPVTFDQIAPVMYDAILSSEDPRFYEHGGIDLIGTTRAILSNVKGDANTQGGSSISQQYVKNVLIQQCDWNAKTEKELNTCWEKATNATGTDGIQRKLQEMRYAIALEQRYSKNDILLGYLNIANFGGTTYGIEAAAQRYFGVSASKLNLAQAATLAGIVQNPNTYRIDLPDSKTNGKGNNYAETKKRQSYVLGRMLHDGKITQKQFDDADKAPITPKITTPTTGCSATYAHYFCEYVTDTITNDPAFGATPDERAQLLRKGGLKIYTTFDARVQQAADAAQAKYSPQSMPGFQFGSASVSIEVGTGRVLAIAQNTKYVPGAATAPGETSVVYAGTRAIGGSDGFNAGSTFKLFTLLDWLEQGHSINEVVDGRGKPVRTFQDSCIPGGVYTNGNYVPKNFANESPRFGTPALFTKLSLNTGYWGMAAQLDLCDIGKMAGRLGVTLGNGQTVPLATDNPSAYEILGSDSVSPLSMAAAYATIAANGIYCQPKVIDKVTDSDNKALPIPDTKCSQVVDPKVAATAASALRGVMQGGGTGSQGNPGDGTQLIGKTGTHETRQTWLITSSTKVTTANVVGTVSGPDSVNLSRLTYNGIQLWNLRYRIARSIQGAIDQWYPGGQFPAPDKNLTRYVLRDLPNVVGMSQDQATQTLTGAGFQVQVGGPVDSDLPAGTIAQQSPGAGKTAGGATVTISPSNGQGLSVPDVSGQKSSDAAAQLHSAGFANVTECKQGDATVSSTDPPSGTMVNRSTTITLTCKDSGKGNGGGPGGNG
ncbi:transglycosylase domain-containing protein [Microbacterium sp.]|uniref:transglycosylase domain-containing protein n=1 Tax=Microbacterium sp. TaxID=51671 RepID=UPI001ACD4FFA|nr:transglycosylase domain-containing protein [Microbacterium sp.]MBN9194039.1 transglycosylase domain-containing protein [Microbacterium sp.]